MMEDQAIALNNEGVQHFLNKEFDRAKQCYQRALELNPDNTSVLNNLGLFYHQQKEFTNALSCFNKAISIEKKPNFLINAGNSLAMMGKNKEAKEHYLSVIKNEPGHVNAQVCMAKISTHEGRLDVAEHYWKALVEQTGKKEFMLELAKVYMLQKAYTTAADLLYTIAESMEQAEIWFQIGRCEFHLKNHGLAEKALKKALSEIPDHLEFRRYLALNYLATGNMEEAMRQLDTIIKLDPANYQVLTEKGIILCSMHRFDLASTLFDRALHLQPDYEKAKYYKKLISK